MADQELVIKISAKNLTSKEFAEARKEIVGLNEEIDKNKGKTGEAETGWKKFGATVQDVGATVLKAGTLIAGAIGAVVAGVIELGKRGADVSDVRAQFDILNRTIGNDSKQAISTLSTAVDGVISRFDLMKITNKALSAGMKATNEDFKVMGEGARVLADRLGGDTKEAYEAITNAMATGKTMRLASIGLNIDETAALADHARVLGVDVDKLNEHGKKIALQTALMAELTAVVKESGRAQQDFGDTLDQARAKFSDWVDDLSVGISNSKVLGEALKGVGEILAAVFGSTSSEQGIKDIVSLIEQAAFVMIEWGRTAVTAGDIIMRVFSGLQVVFDAVMVAVARVAQGFALFVQGIATVGSVIPGMSAGMKQLAEFARQDAIHMGGLAKGFTDAGGAALQHAIGVRDSNDMLVRLDRALVSVRDKMISAKASTDENTVATTGNAGATRDRAGMGQTLAASLADEEKAWDALSARIVANRAATTSAQDAVGKGFGGQPGVLMGMAQTMGNVNLGSKMVSPVGSLIGALGAEDTGGMRDAIKAAFATPILGGFSDMFKNDVPSTIIGALTGGGNPVKAVGSLIGNKLGENIGGMASQKIGGMIGGAMGTIMGPVGTILGSMAGKFIGMGIGKLVGKIGGGPSKEEKQARAESGDVSDFIASTLTAQQKAEAGGESWKMTVIGVRDAYLKVGKTAEEAQADVAAMWNDKDPKAHLAAIEKIQGVYQQQQKDAQDLDKAIQKYGFSLEELGPQMRKQKLHDQALTLANDFRLLVGAGIDMGTVVKKMGGEMNKFIQTSVKTGTEVPNEMRPMIEKMIEMGELTDENGNKITSMNGSGITFATTMTQGFENVVAAMNRVAEGLGIKIPEAAVSGAGVVVDAVGGISGAASGAAEAVSGPLTSAFDKTGKMIRVVAGDARTLAERIRGIPDRTIKIRYDEEGFPTGDGGEGGEGEPPPAFASEAFVRSPTLAMVGDTAGGEFVLKPSTIKNWMGQAAMAGQGAGGGPSLVVNINAVAANVEGIRTLVYTEIGPKLLDWLNKGGAPQTDLKRILE